MECNETVKVELSQPLAWLIRDLIGLERFGHKATHVYPPSFQEDMLRLNAALPYRENNEVAEWAKRAAHRLMER